MRIGVWDSGRPRTAQDNLTATCLTSCHACPVILVAHIVLANLGLGVASAPGYGRARGDRRYRVVFDSKSQ